MNTAKRVLNKCLGKNNRLEEARKANLAREGQHRCIGCGYQWDDKHNFVKCPKCGFNEKTEFKKSYKQYVKKYPDNI